MSEVTTRAPLLTAHDNGIRALKRTVQSTESLICAVMALGENNYSGTALPTDSPSISVNLIAREARRRGLEVAQQKDFYFQIDGLPVEANFMWSGVGTSAYTWHITQRKSLTRKLLERGGLPTPAGQTFQTYERALKYFQLKNRSVVVKPSKGAYGKGVTVDITTPASFQAAWQYAQQWDDRTLVEQYLTGDVVRVITVGNRAVAAYIRQPAQLIGDGITPVKRLVADINRRRTENPRLRQHLIRDKLLASAGIDPESVLPLNAVAEIPSFGNVTAGGYVVSLIDYLHRSILELAERAAACFPSLYVAGVDVMASDISMAAETPEMAVIEVDAHPHIGDAVFPSYGRPVDVPKHILDWLAWGGDRHASTSPWRWAGGKASPYDHRGAIAGFSRSYDLQPQLVQQAAYRRGLQVEALSRLTYSISSSKRDIFFLETMSHWTSAMSRRTSNDKDWTKRRLQQMGVNTPAWQTFLSSEMEKAWDFARALACSVTVKPFVGSGGRGITVDVTSRDAFEEAWATANLGQKSRALETRKIIVEEYVRGADYRLFVLGDQIIAASLRIPAHLIGDGQRTVDELVEQRDKTRQVNPHNGSKRFKLTPAMEANLLRLGKSRLSVLAEGEYVQLHAVANIGSGGDSRDVTDMVHPEFTHVAQQIGKAMLSPPHFGIDILAENIGLAPDAQKWSVIEVNTNPDPGIHHFPSEGAPRDVTGALLDMLFPEAKDIAPTSIEVCLRVQGKVQGVGFRRWVARRAPLFGAQADGTNLENGDLEVTVRGPRCAIEAMIEQCRKGPESAKVKKLEVYPATRLKSGASAQQPRLLPSTAAT